MAAPVFIDSVHAAEILRVSQDAILDLVKAGKLRTYGGRASNPFLRSAEVQALAGEVGAGDADEPPKRVKSSSARVRARLTADSRWSEVTEEDIRDWASRVDVPTRRAARTAARTAVERLDVVLRAIEEAEAGPGPGAS